VPFELNRPAPLDPEQAKHTCRRWIFICHRAPLKL
jgi:hypothetical protein